MKIALHSQTAASVSINSIQKLFKGKAQNQILGWGAGIILAVGTTTYLSRLARIAKSIVIITRSDFDKSSIQYVVHISFKNPVSQSIRVKYPFVKLSYQGTTLASSVPSNQVITIPANGTVEATLRIDFDKEKLLPHHLNNTAINT